MDIEKNKPSAPRLDDNLKSNHETIANEMPQTIKETIAKNKEVIDRSRRFLEK